jgi:energy-converting hydrogenase Eha subunit A
MFLCGCARHVHFLSLVVTATLLSCFICSHMYQTIISDSKPTKFSWCDAGEIAYMPVGVAGICVVWSLRIRHTAIVRVIKEKDVRCRMLPTIVACMISMASPSLPNCKYAPVVM